MHPLLTRTAWVLLGGTIALLGGALWQAHRRLTLARLQLAQERVHADGLRTVIALAPYARRRNFRVMPPHVADAWRVRGKGVRA